MAHHLSAVKRHRQSEKRRARRVARIARLRSAEKKLRQAVESKNQTVAHQQLSATVSEIMRARSKGLLHRRTAARKISRLSRTVHRALAAKH